MHLDLPDFLGFWLGVTGFVLGFIEFYWVFMGLTGFFRVLLGFYWVFTRFYWVLLSVTEIYWVVPGFTEFYRVLLSFNGMFTGFFFLTVQAARKLETLPEYKAQQQQQQQQNRTGNEMNSKLVACRFSFEKRNEAKQKNNNKQNEHVLARDGRGVAGGGAVGAGAGLRPLRRAGDVVPLLQREDRPALLRRQRRRPQQPPGPARRRRRPPSKTKKVVALGGGGGGGGGGAVLGEAPPYGDVSFSDWSFLGRPRPTVTCRSLIGRPPTTARWRWLGSSWTTTRTTGPAATAPTGATGSATRKDPSRAG